MIKFFRKIRHNLMLRNRTSKYILYAFGEIILVVIGILIALQINNWNEERKQNKELENIIRNLSQEFNANRKELNNILKQIDYTKNGALELLSFTGKPLTISEDDANIIIEKSLFFPTWKPTNFTLDELKNTGKLALIKNNTLKNLLFKWENQIGVIDEWNRRVEKSSQDIIDYIKAHGSLRKLNHERIGVETSNIKLDNTELLNDVQFENQIDEKVLYAQFMKENFINAEKLISEILNIVNDR